MSIDREVKTYSHDQFVGSIQQADFANAPEGSGLRIAIQNVTNVRRKIHRAAQPAGDGADYSDVPKVRAGTGTALQLIEAASLVGLVGIPAVERNQTHA